VTGQSLIGRVGRVTHRVRGGESPGEVRVVVEGLPHYYIAYCAEPVAAGQHVLVINSRGARQVDVEPWQDKGPDIGIPFTD
jgi:membrane protein implicated in regulation of membrane protease activity